ncbi:hypothetical protein [Phytohabitans houttuyneae]|uniref:Uncharacterized protein n=2 Tax=Phytohabitans houttuyneae TaxID=1076126 RepID=A0A6V8KTZ6_9ACTN|nr:hypothetical protein [Phytohabitans houttuyneae]GFJ85779.1 hypothetical protein Phou_099590 [Phytohabitans houttuyneae]
MANSPMLAQLVSLVVRDAAGTDHRADGYADAVRAVTAAVTVTESPAIFGDSLEMLLKSPAALDVAGPPLAASLEDIAGKFQKLEPSNPRAARRAADAVEALTRLALAGVSSPYALLAILERFDAPQPKPVGTAVVRAVGTAVDHWPHAAGLASIVRLVAGIDPAKGTARHGADPDDVASDATWVLAGIELVSALRASELTAMTRHLETCAAYLRTATETYGREDAGVLLTLVEILLGLLQESGVPPTVEALAMPQLAPDALESLADRIRRINVASIGLNHWYGDPKTAALHAWTRLANDLHRLRVEFARDSFYKAQVVIDDLLQIYMGSRSVTVVRRDEDADGLQMLVQPVIETGFARTAGLLSNLEDHTDALEQQVTEAAHDRRLALTEQLKASRAVLAAARSHALGGTGQGKEPGGTAATPLPPPLDRLVPHGSPIATELATLSKATLVDLARAVDNATIGRHSLNLIESEIFAHTRAALAKSPDFRPETSDAIDELLRLIIRFVTTRTNAQSNLYGYLFDPDANEEAVHQDLHNYLIGNSIGSIAEFEVQHVGGGRVDLRVKFDGFAIHIEMKVDSTKIAIDDKTAYLKQAVAYQGSDIRIGFLVALRHKAFDATGPVPHISRLIGHAEFNVDGDTIPRHIITVQIPGSRTKPSEMK